MASAMMQDEAGIADKNKVPDHEAFNGVRIQMLPTGTQVDAASPNGYRPMGFGAQCPTERPFTRASSPKRALELLETGDEPPHDAFVPLPIVTPDTVKVCKGVKSLAGIGGWLHRFHAETG